MLYEEHDLCHRPEGQGRVQKVCAVFSWPSGQKDSNSSMQPWSVAACRTDNALAVPNAAHLYRCMPLHVAWLLVSKRVACPSSTHCSVSLGAVRMKRRSMSSSTSAGGSMLTALRYASADPC